jgi:hypothetical protein
VVSPLTPPAMEKLSYESVVTAAKLDNDVVRIELVRFCTAGMHVVVEPCCTTSKHLMMQRYQLIKRSKMLGLLSSCSNI